MEHSFILSAKFDCPVARILHFDYSGLLDFLGGRGVKEFSFSGFYWDCARYVKNL